MKIDLSEAEDPTIVGPGTYTVVVTDAKEGRSSKKQTPQIELDLEIQGGEYNGRGLREFLYLTPKALWRVGLALKALGVPVPEEGEFQLDPSTLIGRKCQVSVKHEVWESNVQTRVDTFSPIENGGGPDVGDASGASADDGVPF